MKAFAGSLLLAAVLAGCGADSSSSPLDTGAPSTGTDTPPTTASTATTGPSTPTAWLDDGRYFGFIKSFDLATQPGRAGFDLADFLIGEEANEAAAERGDETPVSNDYYIVNDDPELRTLDVSLDVRIVLLDWRHCCEKTFMADPERFQDSFASQTRHAGNYRGSLSPYWLTVENGVVATIEEQYLP